MFYNLHGTSFLWSLAHEMEGSEWEGVDGMIHFHRALFHVSSESRLIEPQGSCWSCCMVESLKSLACILSDLGAPEKDNGTKDTREQTITIIMNLTRHLWS